MKKTFKQLVKDIGYTFYGDDTIAIPKKMKGIVEVFTVGKYISDDELRKEYTNRNLVPADPFTVLEYVKNSDKKYIATHWKDADDKWCFSTFDRWFDERDVHVDRSGNVWDDGWWFAGLRKSALSPSDTQNSSDTRLQNFVSELKILIEKYDK